MSDAFRIFPPVVGKSLRRTRAAAFKYQLEGLSFVGPAVVFFVIFGFYPLFHAFRLSFQRWNILGDPVFVGVQNYRFILQRGSQFLQAMGVTVQFIVLFIASIIVLAFLFANLLNRPLPFKTALRAAYFMPYVSSWVVVSIIWLYIFHPSYGPTASIAQWLGVPPVRWLQESSLALPSIALVAVWKELGFYMIIFLAGLQEIPQMYYDCAEMDGASETRKMFSITIPLMRRTILFAAVISTINSFQMFIPSYVMTQGGPSDSTRVAVLLIYETGFEHLRMGRAAAMAAVLFACILALSLLQFKVLKGGADQ